MRRFKIPVVAHLALSNPCREASVNWSTLTRTPSWRTILIHNKQFKRGRRPWPALAAVAYRIGGQLLCMKKSLSFSVLDNFVTAGLMIKDDRDIGDQKFKFALDPIAEYLAAKEPVIQFRDGELDRDEFIRIRDGFSAESDLSAQIGRTGRALGVHIG